jgi:hypothetical protein
MQVREAKDFLVQQTAVQAQLENVPLSDLEKRMMYFTETQETEGESEPEDTDEGIEDMNYDYEAKISSLLHHAYSRLKRQKSADRELWDEAIKTLAQGDHYLLVLWRHTPYQKLSSHLFSPSFWKLFALALLVLIAIMIGFVAYLFYTDSKPIHRDAVHLIPNNFSNSASLKIFTPNSFAFSYFDPGSVPTTT